MRTLIAATLWILMAVPGWSADDASVHMQDPRGFGYFVGDLLQRTVEIDAADGETFVAATLPQPGKLAYWLELKSVEPAEARDGRYRLALTLTYQLFYLPIDTRKVKIPATNVELKGPAGTRIVTIPAFTFLISPIREIYPEKSGETTETFLKPDATPQRLSTAAARTGALGFGLLSLFALTLLAHHRAWWPFHARPGRPFTEAQRVIVNHRTAYATALIALHRAFDQSWGRRLLGEDLEPYLSQRSEQTESRVAIERFFAASRTYFFAGDDTAAEASFPRSELDRLASDLAIAERSAR